MKKILLLIAAVGILMTAVSCGDDEPKRGNGVFTVSEAMVNHAFDTQTDQVLGVSTTHCKVTVDTKKLTATIELTYNDGQGIKTLTLDDLTVKSKGLKFFELSSSSMSNFNGYVDINEESSMRYFFTTADGIRIISMTPDVFFLKTKNTVSYDDGASTSETDNVMYTFHIEPTGNTAIVTVAGIVHAKDVKYFNSITAASVPFTVTPNGFTFNGENLKTDAIYRNYVDSTGSVISHTDKYPFKTFNATVDLVNDRLEANYMIGNSATVTATGCTYLDVYDY